MIRIAVFLAIAAGAVPVRPAEMPDAYLLWQQGAFRGANVMQAQCTRPDLGVLRAWGANLAEIPVSSYSHFDLGGRAGLRK